jgi:hypothetical protein
MVQPKRMGMLQLLLLAQSPNEPNPELGSHKAKPANLKARVEASQRVPGSLHLLRRKLSTPKRRRGGKNGRRGSMLLRRWVMRYALSAMSRK